MSVELRILVLDDERLKGTAALLHRALAPFLGGQDLGEFQRLIQAERSVQLRGLLAEEVYLLVNFNKSDDAGEVSRELCAGAFFESWDLVLIDDLWGDAHPEGGRTRILPAVLENLKRPSRRLPRVVLWTNQWLDETRSSLFAAFQRGASDGDKQRLSGLWKEDVVSLRVHVQQAAQDRAALLEVERQAEHGQERAGRTMIGECGAIRRVLDAIEQAAPSNAAILLTGETGTGKELAARAIHAGSSRAEQPFVVANCASLSESLLETELFGHEKGAFTGATTAKCGLFEVANGGTLFFDEIGDFSPATQVKLLRFLENREFCRVGSTQTITVDARVVAATNKDLPRMVTEGRFRQDLYYRVNVVNIQLPPLRDRGNDVIRLASHYLMQYGGEGSEARALSPAAERALLAYGWPGNIRELENVVQRVLLFAKGDMIEAEHLRLGADAEAQPEAGRTPEKACLVPVAGEGSCRGVDGSIPETRGHGVKLLGGIRDSGEPEGAAGVAVRVRRLVVDAASALSDADPTKLVAAARKMAGVIAGATVHRFYSKDEFAPELWQMRRCDGEQQCDGTQCWMVKGPTEECPARDWGGCLGVCFCVVAVAWAITDQARPRKGLRGVFWGDIRPLRLQSEKTLIRMDDVVIHRALFALGGSSAVAKWKALRESIPATVRQRWGQVGLWGKVLLKSGDNVLDELRKHDADRERVKERIDALDPALGPLRIAISVGN